MSALLTDGSRGLLIYNQAIIRSSSEFAIEIKQQRQGIFTALPLLFNVKKLPLANYVLPGFKRYDPPLVWASTVSRLRIA